MQQVLHAEDDGLFYPDVGGWAEDKYRLIALYDELFSTGMKNKWDQRVYIDLYAGAGYGRIQGTRKVLKGSPIIALTVRNPFDKYIFCEQDPKCMTALQARVKRISPTADVTFVPGSCDLEIEKVCAAIPASSSTKKVLSLCLVDPFGFGIKFTTLRRLSKARLDFVVLLAIEMDANRNYDRYLDVTNPKIDEALGNTDWRDRWKGKRRKEFTRFLAEEFSKSMTSLGYLETKFEQMKHMRSVDKNLPLYHLALFSQHKTAFKFWDDVLKYSTDQPSFSWD